MNKDDPILKIEVFGIWKVFYEKILKHGYRKYSFRADFPEIAGRKNVQIR
jgi:hypothetical protein